MAQAPKPGPKLKETVSREVPAKPDPAPDTAQLQATLRINIGSVDREAFITVTANERVPGELPTARLELSDSIVPDRYDLFSVVGNLSLAQLERHKAAVDRALDLMKG